MVDQSKQENFFESSVWVLFLIIGVLEILFSWGVERWQSSSPRAHLNHWSYSFVNCYGASFAPETKLINIWRPG